MNELSGRTDEQVLAEARAGGRKALEALFEQHQDSLWRLALLAAGRPDLAEDAVQEAFVGTLRRLKNLPPGGLTRTYLARAVTMAASNLARSEVRRRRREERVSKPCGECSLQEAAERREAVAAASAALAGLDPDERLAVALRHREDFSLTETAVALGVPVSTAESRVQRGLENIRKRLVASGFGALAAPVLLDALGLAGPAHAPASLVGKLGALVVVKETGAAAVSAAAKGGMAMKVIAVVVAAGVLAGAAVVAPKLFGGAQLNSPPATEAKAEPEVPFIVSYWCSPTLDGTNTVAERDFVKKPWDAKAIEANRQVTVERFKDAAKCGFNLALPVEGHIVVDPSSAKYLLEFSQAAGLKAMIGDPRLRKALTVKPEDPQFAKLLDEVVAEYSNHPALGAYMIEDEPEVKGSTFPQLAAVVKYLRQKDPKHFAFINLLPNYGFYPSLGEKAYENHVRDFIAKVKPAVVSWDHYQFFDKNEVRYFENMEVVWRECLKSRTPWFQIIESSDKEGFLRWQVWTTLSYGSRGIMYFTYFCVPGAGPALINHVGQKNPGWEIARKINAQVWMLAPTLLKLRSQAVYHTEPLPKGTQGLAADAPVKKAEGGELVLGWLKDESGGDYLFVVNRSWEKKAVARLTLDAKAGKVEEISRQTGKPEAAKYAAEARILEVELEPGDGRLFKLSK